MSRKANKPQPIRDGDGQALLGQKTKPPHTNGIIAEKSQRSPDETPWWWLTGDTYPHRDELPGLMNGIVFDRLKS